MAPAALWLSSVASSTMNLPPRRAAAGLDLGFLAPLLELLRIDLADRLRLALVALVELQRLVHAHRLLAVGADVDRALDQAHDLAIVARAAPEVGAADPGGHLRHAHADLALLALADELGGEAERALEHLQRGLEQVLAGLHLGEHEAPVLAQLHYASFGELHLHARAAAREDAVARAQLHARRERHALAVALQPRRHLHAVHHRARLLRHGRQRRNREEKTQQQ